MIMILAANWKMHITPTEARRFGERFLARIGPRPGRRLVFFPSAVALEATALGFRERSDISVGAQDVYWEPKGAFTGAISAPLVAGAGATAALVGHSERRHVFGETEEDTHRKVRAVLDAGLTPFLCVGETLEQREREETEPVVLTQLEAATARLSRAELARLVLAYEPVWAIGTGRTATPSDAAQVHRVLRERLVARGGDGVPILYGGSVNPGNTAALLGEWELDGVLVGGASLDPDTWSQVIEAADQVRPS